MLKGFTGLILSFSLLLAAGAAVYENPQVKQWVDENRRKVALALHQLGDELAPQPSRRSESDASTREDDSPEAAERRRRARTEILERGRVLEERKRAARQAHGRGMVFDDLVHKDGSLREDEPENATTTAAETQVEEGALRHRAVPPPIPPKDSAEEGLTKLHIPQPNETSANEDYSRSSTPTFPISPPVPPKPEAYRLQRPLINMDEISNHPSEQLVDLTPTTSASSAAADLADLDHSAQEPSTEMYMSVNEWAHNQSVHSFPSPPESPSRSSTHTLEADERSVADNIEHASQAGTEDMDVMSEFEEGINTPSTWTEVGSQVSEQ